MNSLYDNLRIEQLSEGLLINEAVLEQTRYFDMTNMLTALFTLSQDATSSQDLEGVKLLQATDINGTAKKAISGASLADAAFESAAAQQKFQLEIDAIALDHENDFKFVALEAKATTTSTTLKISVSVVANPAYKSENLSVDDADTDAVKVPAGGSHGS